MVHPRAEVEGKDVVQDLGLHRLQAVLDNRTEDDVQFLNYSFEGREKFIAYAFIPERNRPRALSRSTRL